MNEMTCLTNQTRYVNDKEQKGDCFLFVFVLFV